MKIKFCITIAFLVTLLVGCLGEKDVNVSQHPLMAEMEGKFSLFVLDNKLDTVTLTMLEEQGIANVHKIKSGTSLKDAQERYAFLKLKKSPTYVVFDYKQLMYKTNDYDKLMDYLKKHQ
jgi:hypothetical protein